MVLYPIKQEMHFRSDGIFKNELQLTLNGASCAMRAARPHTPACGQPSWLLRPNQIQPEAASTFNYML
jgi:hypothetical protein